MDPTIQPTMPTLDPTPDPTPHPTTNPTAAPSTAPSLTPSNAPSSSPTPGPTLEPTVPSLPPSPAPTMPTINPTLDPTGEPTVPPSNAPSFSPYVPPTNAPTVSPSNAPSSPPSAAPSDAPSMSPTARPTMTPSLVPTQSPLPTEIVRCAGSGVRCQCDGTRQCVIQCLSKDDCKDSQLLCPEGHWCSVECSDITCVNARVTGPVAHDFSISCQGTNSCEDARVNSVAAADVTVSCGGKDACKGSQLNCGTGHCSMAFQGESAGADARILVNDAMSFKCSGSTRCPADFTAAPTTPPPTPPPPTPKPSFVIVKPPTLPVGIPLVPAPAPGSGTGSGSSTIPSTPTVPTTKAPCSTAMTCPLAQLFNDAECRCECPYRAEGTTCPLLHVWNENECRCQLDCPYDPPTEAECAYFGLRPRDCSCYPSTHCCLTANVGPTASSNPLQWAGLCWSAVSELECNALSTDLCRWDTANCLADPPVNSIQPDTPCQFMDALCRWDGDCCSEYCGANGRCW